jgi:hypothetical protein
MLPSSPSTTTADNSSGLWAHVGMDEMQMPSPTPSLTPSYSPEPFASYCEPEYYPAPMPTCMPTSVPTTMAFEPIIPTYTLPSVIAQQCGVDAGFDSFGGFDWERTDWGFHYAMPTM